MWACLRASRWSPAACPGPPSLAAPDQCLAHLLRLSQVGP